MKYDAEIQTLGRLVALVALKSVGVGSVEAGAALRVAGFDRPIVECALRELRKQIESDSGARLIVKVGTSEPIDMVPADYLLAPDEQLTTWRNETGRGVSVILFDYGTPPDAQGLAAVNQLNDAVLLAGPNSNERNHRFEMFIREAWSEVGGAGKVPDALVAYLLRVWGAVTQEDERSLRRWARYLVATTREVVESPLRTLEVVQSAIARSLPSLGLFPDGDMFNADAALEGRLQRNVRVSALSLDPPRVLLEEAEERVGGLSERV